MNTKFTVAVCLMKTVGEKSACNKKNVNLISSFVEAEMYLPKNSVTSRIITYSTFVVLYIYTYTYSVFYAVTRIRTCMYLCADKINNITNLLNHSHSENKVW